VGGLSPTWVLMGVVLVAWPLYSAWSWPRRRQVLQSGDPDVRRRVTLGTIARQWTLAAAVGSAWWWEGRSLEVLRVTTVPDGWQWAAVGVGAGLGLWFARNSLAAAADPEARAMARQIVDPALLSLMPQTPTERLRFDALAVTAGICEEFLFRGVLWALLLPWIEGAAALLVTSVAFGMAHLYQGRRGMLRTGMVGAVLGGLAWASGTLWLVVVLHAVVDMVQGRLLAAAAAERWCGGPDVPPQLHG